MYKRSMVFVLILSLILVGCTEAKKQSPEEPPKQETRTFQEIQVPSMITDPEQRLEYVAKHYWDKFDFTDTAYIHLPEVTGQAFANYIAILMYNSPEIVSESVKATLKKAEAEKKMFDYFAGQFEHYLYDPNSPMRNDELFIPALEAMLASDLLDETNKIRPAHLLDLVKKNRVGAKANNFIYTLANGTDHTLNNVQSEYLILYFYNPDCENCRAITEALKQSIPVNDLMSKGRLKILAVYPDGDIAEWRSHLPQMPQSWINGYDKNMTVQNEEIYDLKAIPTLYLLDRNKTVILKDTSFGNLQSFIVEVLL